MVFAPPPPAAPGAVAGAELVGVIALELGVGCVGCACETGPTEVLGFIALLVGVVEVVSD